MPCPRQVGTVQQATKTRRPRCRRRRVRWWPGLLPRVFGLAICAPEADQRWTCLQWPEHDVVKPGPGPQASLIVDPANGQLPALTEDRARRARRWKETAGQPAGP